MSVRNIMICSAVILTAFNTPGLAATDEIIVETAPPAIVTETTPPARTGYIWAPGYQHWVGDRYEWVPGHFVEARIHSHWAPDAWEKVDDNHWRFKAGHWEAD